MAEIDIHLLQVLEELSLGLLRWPLFLYGPAGTGKTCAALTLCDYSYGSSYETVASLAEKHNTALSGQLTWRRGGWGGKIHLHEFWSVYVGAHELFVLDELGTRNKVSDHQYDVVKTAIDSRHPKPAIYISNVGLGEIEQIYDDRIASRLSAGTVFCLDGRDRRQVQ